MMKNGILLICLLGLTTALSAQKYRTAAGVRLGNSFGLTIQQKLFKSITVEGILQTSIGGSDQSRLTILLEQHQKLLGRRINFYYGAGIHKAWYESDAELTGLKSDAGITAVTGIEATFGRLNLSVDYKPIFNVVNGERFYRGQTGMSLRYVFIKAKKRKINWKFWKKRN